MATPRYAIRRAIQFATVGGAAVVCVVSAAFALKIANQTLIAGLDDIPDNSAQLTLFVLEWKDRLPAIGAIAAVVVLLLTLMTFLMTKDDGTRLHALLIIVSAGFSFALLLVVTVSVALVVLPGLVNGT